MALIAHAGCVDGSTSADGNSGDLPPRRLEEHVALALRVDAVDQPRTVRAGDQVALAVPCESANMRLVAPEKQLRRCAQLANVDAIDGSGIARGNIKPPRRVEGQVPDVMGFGAGRILAQAGSSLVQLSGVED